jgi:hypothetical protein
VRGVRRASGSVSGFFIRIVHSYGIGSICNDDYYANNLSDKRYPSQSVQEVPPKVCKINLDVALGSMPSPIRTIAKYASIALMLIISFFCVATGLVVIQTRLPFSRGIMIWVNLTVGCGLLALGAVIICWVCSSCVPAHSDYPPVVNVSLPSPDPIYSTTPIDLPASTWKPQAPPPSPVLL